LIEGGDGRAAPNRANPAALARGDPGVPGASAHRPGPGMGKSRPGACSCAISPRAKGLAGGDAFNVL